MTSQGPPDLESVPTTNQTAGEPTSMTNKVLLAGAGMVQDLSPLKSVCAHLNAFHAYADEPARAVETNHYCGHLNESVRQCLLYDGPGPGARLIGIEYMITPALYETLDAAERRLWHSHVYEVKSGMLVMPLPAGAPVPRAAWEAAERREMDQVVRLYGKAYHLWQVDRGDALPLGPPRLMTSFTADGQLDFGARVADRDRRFGEDYAHKVRVRADMDTPEIHPDADQAWKKQTE